MKTTRSSTTTTTMAPPAIPSWAGRECGGERACGRSKRRAGLFPPGGLRAFYFRNTHYPPSTADSDTGDRTSPWPMASLAFLHTTHPSYSTRTARNRRKPYLLGNIPGSGGKISHLLGTLSNFRALGNHDYVLLAFLLFHLVFLGLLGADELCFNTGTASRAWGHFVSF